MSPDDLADNARDVADWYMRHKGFGDSSPREVSKLEDLLCWYFWYELEEGGVELEVFYDRELTPAVRVTTFQGRRGAEPLSPSVDHLPDRREVPAGLRSARR